MYSNGNTQRRRFTADDDATILRLIDEGRTYREIGQAMSRASGSIGVRLGRLRAVAAGTVVAKQSKPPRAPRASAGQPTPAARQRPCLCCNRTFFSHGPGNRLCSSCRQKDVSPYATF